MTLRTTFNKAHNFFIIELIQNDSFALINKLNLALTGVINRSNQINITRLIRIKIDTYL